MTARSGQPLERGAAYVTERHECERHRCVLPAVDRVIETEVPTMPNQIRRGQPSRTTTAS